MTIAAHWEPFTIPYGEVVVQGDAVTAYLEKPARPVRISSGTYVLSPDACRLITPGRAVDVPELFDLLTRQAGRIKRAQQQGAYQHEEGHHPWRAHVVAAEQPSHAHSMPNPS